ncbi:4'-phosphopantetheinyl transferase [Cytobacillus purgationiresistens]|uniref:4'-phosphopantetheinyl transferase n=1 Tax=Cytobacillus purgationiresistens TaxID=863449 RepID=A0ABU0AC23_9BACI|nr:4'-phosphopantetheinyl transferase superfamily protein [Cytobacillus purgationiresistens]MDQ0268266.1 4'-phosphopantetheinyl transferase [Cytobacillus purgationiresistens]
MMKFRHIDDAYRTLTGSLLLRSVLNEQYGVPITSQNFSYNAFGKPCLQMDKQVHFNLSHAGDWCVCAVDWEGIGIDIKKVKSIPRGLEKLLLTGEERQYMPINQLNDIFFKRWTLTESYVKSIGTGLNTPLDSVEIHQGGDGMIITEHRGRIYPSGKCKMYDIEEQYKLSVCSLGDNPVFDKDMVQVELSELI